MTPTRLTVALALVALAPADAADPVPRTDLFGDPLPPGAVARLGTTRYRVRGWHQQVFLSPDGNTVIGKGEEGILVFWDAATGKTLAEIRAADLFNWTADQSPDGTRLAVFGLAKTDKPPYHPTLRLYDLTTRKALWTSTLADTERGEPRAVRFTPDGKHLVTAGPDVRVWDAGNGAEQLRQKIPIQYGGMDVSPDGKTIAVGYYDLHLWDWESGAAPRKADTGMRFHTETLRFAPDGRTLYVLGAGEVARAVDVTTGKMVGRLPTGLGARWVVFSPDGKTYATGYHNLRDSRTRAVTLHDAATGKETRRLPCGSKQAEAGVWSRDGKRFAAVTDYRVWVWDVATGKALGPDLPAHEAMIGDLAFSSDGRLFSASDDHTVRAWVPATGKQLLCLDMDYWVRGVAVSQDGSLVAGNALGNDLRVWDAKTGKQQFRLLGNGEMGGRRWVRFSADDQRFLSFGDDHYLRVWDTLTGKLKAEHRFRPPGLEGDDDDDDDRMRDMRFESGPADLGPDGDTLYLCAGKDVRVIAAETGKERFKFEADPRHVEQLRVSADGKKLVTSGPGVAPAPPLGGQVLDRPKDVQVTIWDLAKAEPIVRFRAPGSSWNGFLTFTADGKRVVTGSGDAVVRFWDATTGAAAGVVELPARPVRVAFSGDGKLLAVAFFDTTALVYDLSAAPKPAAKE
jgi:WD40 repeat protein